MEFVLDAQWAPNLLIYKVSATNTKEFFLGLGPGQMNKGRKNDVFWTHCAPSRVLKHHFAPRGKWSQVFLMRFLHNL